ncbi:MAG: tetratricopeptide repeat protein [Bacteroidales bacterium]|jgi:TolA-binding protein|nr:tetratricopeptide repeat protein [Bacteroidales bacterium]
MKRNIFNLILLVSLLITAGSKTATAQRNEVVKEPNRLLEDANGKFNDHNYATAYQLYADYITLFGNGQDLSTQKAYYNKAVSAAKMFNNAAEKELRNFIETFPDNSLRSDACIELADFYFQRADYANAVLYYDKAETITSDADKALEIRYKRGYSLFQNGNKTKAQQEFAKVKDSKSKYAPAATYFHSHILYEKGDYDKALSGFETLRNDKNFRKIVPYYVAQIYYKQGQYGKLIEIAQQLLLESDSKRNNELGYMLGDSFFKLKKYKEAIPYLKEAVDNDTLFDQNKNYELGYCLFKTEKYKEAIDYLKLINNNDSLTQNAYYYLGCCALEQQDTLSARDYYRQASAMDFDKVLKDDALFLYAKLCYLQPSPYNEAIDALNKYIARSKDHNKSQEAKTMLAKIFSATKNYQQALDLLEQIDMPDRNLKGIMQRTRLNRAVELFNEKRDPEALALLDKCEKETYDNQITAAAYYLKNEIYYRNNKFDEAEKYINMFYSSPDVTKNPYYFKANYSMGYILFRQQKYAVAKDYFQRFLVNTSQEEPKRIADAHNRYADCLFMCKDFNGAIKQYDYAINENSLDVDYAYYQKALALGATGKTNEEITLLKETLLKFNQSKYAASMLFETGNAYILLNDNQKALEYYEKQIQQYPSSVHTKESLGKAGMIYYNMDNDKKALEVLDKLVKRYPGTEQSKAGLLQIRTIYVEQNRVDDFFNYVKNIPHTTISNDEQDSLLYQAAEMQYLSGECSPAITGFQDYIFRFPQGSFITNAHYYLADCLAKNGQPQQALESYIAVCDAPVSKFTHQSLLRSASIAYSLEQYALAEKQYLRLEAESEINTHSLLAKMGRTRSLFHLNDWTKVIVCAKATLEDAKLTNDERDEIIYMLAHSYLALNDTTNALLEFAKLKNSSNGEYYGEANFFFAQNEFNKGDYEASEKIIHGITANPSSEYWLARTFILWGDIFHAKGNDLQAKQTYQSIIDNYDGEDLVIKAGERLNTIKEQEEQAKKINEQEVEVAKQEVDEVIIDK